MSVSQFRSLVENSCRLLELEVAELYSVPGDGPQAVTLDIADVRITLAFEPRRDASRIFFLCQLGLIPAERETDILRRLLETTHSRLSDDAAILSMDPESGEAILEYNVAITSTTPERLVASLKGAAETALLWRECHFLEAERRPAVVAESADFA